MIFEGVFAWLHNVHIMGFIWLGGHNVIKFISTSGLASAVTNL